jgi:hypothetical protein
MNLRARVIQLERKTRRTDGGDEHLCIEILVVPSRGADSREEREILLRLGGDDDPDTTGRD